MFVTVLFLIWVLYSFIIIIIINPEMFIDVLMIDWAIDEIGHFRIIHS